MTQIYATYADRSLDNLPLTGYIEMLEDQYNDGTRHLYSKDLMAKTEVNYNDIKSELKFRVNSKIQYLMLALKDEIE